ncbi:MAG: DUF309 domain-containing protein [Elainellaceae cyanobacterium]
MEAAIAQEFSRGVEQFNRGEFYACHDTLEALWMEAGEPDRTFFQGVLQLAVGLYHLTHHNWQGAVTLLGNGISRLRPYGPNYDGTDVDHLLDWSAVLLQRLQLAGPEAIADSAQQLVATTSGNVAAGTLVDTSGASPYTVRYSKMEA